MCAFGVVVFEGCEVGESAVAAGRESPGLFENDFAGGRFRPDLVRQRRAVGGYRRCAVAPVGRGILALVLNEGVVVASDVDGVGRERQPQLLSEILRTLEMPLDIEIVAFVPGDLFEHPRRIAVIGERVAEAEHLLRVARDRRAEVLDIGARESERRQ